MGDKLTREISEAWFIAHGYVREGEYLWAIAWSDRHGHDFVSLEFFSYDQPDGSIQWGAIVGHHASGMNPRMGIGDCENLADIIRTHEAIRLINGYPTAEAELRTHEAAAKARIQA